MTVIIKSSMRGGPGNSLSYLSLAFISHLTFVFSLGLTHGSHPMHLISLLTPITPNSASPSLARGSLPIVVVQNYSELSREFLEKEWNRISNIPQEKWDWTRLRFAHWAERIGCNNRAALSWTLWQEVGVGVEGCALPWLGIFLVISEEPFYAADL